MSTQNAMWKSERKAAKSKIRTAPGDALITAACIVYHGPLDSNTRAELLEDWLHWCNQGTFDTPLIFGQNFKPISLSAKMESLMRPTYSITDSTHSLMHTETIHTDFSHKGDDVSSLHETERASSAGSSMHPMYRNIAVYDTSIHFRLENRLDNIDMTANIDLESIDASSFTTRNLLAVREKYTLEDILSSFEEYSTWKGKNLPTDSQSIQNAIIMKICCGNRKHCWPLLIDPDNQAEMWVKILQESQNMQDVNVNTEQQPADDQDNKTQGECISSIVVYFMDWLLYHEKYHL